MFEMFSIVFAWKLIKKLVSQTIPVAALVGGYYGYENIDRISPYNKTLMTIEQVNHIENSSYSKTFRFAEGGRVYISRNAVDFTGTKLISVGEDRKLSKIESSVLIDLATMCLATQRPSENKNGNYILITIFDGNSPSKISTDNNLSALILSRALDNITH